MWAFVVVFMLSIQNLPMASTPDGNAAYLITPEFRLAFGPLPSGAISGFASKSACQAYEIPNPTTGLYPWEPYVYSYTDQNTSLTYTWTFTNANGAALTNQTFNVVGCEKAL